MNETTLFGVNEKLLTMELERNIRSLANSEYLYINFSTVIFLVFSVWLFLYSYLPELVCCELCQVGRKTMK